MKKAAGTQAAGSHRALLSARSGYREPGQKHLLSMHGRRCSGMLRRWFLLAVTSVMLAACLTGTAEERTAVTYHHGDTESGRVAITVDDCYSIKQVRAILDLCAQYDIRCTFFVIGEAMKYKDAEVWKQVVKSGCEIGNHSWGHTNLTKLKGHEIEFQMLRTQQKVDAVLGYHYPMQVMRPPFGATNKLVADSVFEVGYPAVVKWDVSETNSAKAIKAVQNGSILLFHARARDVRCLRKLIPLIFEKGFDCVTVSELLELGPIEVDEHSDMYIYDPKSGM